MYLFLIKVGVPNSGRGATSDTKTKFEIFEILLSTLILLNLFTMSRKFWVLYLLATLQSFGGIKTYREKLYLRS